MQNHIKSFWQESEDDQELREKFLVELPHRGVHAFIIQFASHEIGYIQYYNASKIGGGWWLNESPGTFGVDLMIGSEMHLGKGFGPRIIKEFIALIKERESDVQSIIIDPAPTNDRAIKAFEKAGFTREREIETPGGRALLMRMRI